MPSSAAGLALKASYTTFGCDKAHQCDNGLCIHPDWRCNGHDDCGDDTDERNCTGPNDTSGMVHSYLVAICLILGILAGVVLAVCIPRLMRRYRHNAYRSFRDEPVVT
ncbi:hypothetical protein C0Q70_17303 [Pomacea canaliculata]|uniref:Uncharacterized protein n=2 Tax=Pomacea canaliculata TaxID=400727 RepID=A0A2T7NK06_POMCA|nr:hypothetical protein C0Q70_17303 [Pomacea canaliculata]